LQDKFISPFRNLPNAELHKYILGLFELTDFPDRSYEESDIFMGYRKNLYQIYKVYLLMLKYDIIGNANEDALNNTVIINRLCEAVFHMNQIITGEHHLTLVVEGRNESPPEEINLFRYTPPNYANNTPYQNLLMYVLNNAFKKGYKLYKGNCYSQIHVSGHATHAWRYECSVEQFIYKCVDKETNYEMWQYMTSARDNVKRCAEYLMNSANDKEFPKLCPDRRIFSFTDGVYDANEVRFYKYGEDYIPPSIVAIKFFKQKFAPDTTMTKDDWYDIDTQDLQHILNYQELSEEVCRVIYAMMGRCLYKVGELDKWELILFIKGVAGSGKSTIGKILKFIYPSEDVAIMSSNIEKKFGLQAIYDKLLFLCLEVKRNFGLDQGDFQSMISGEDVSIAKKHGVALSIPWEVPGALFGNEVAAAWVDASNSMTRRIVCCDFKKRVRNSDMLLMKRLKASIPRIIHKINVAYLVAYKAFGSTSLWEHLPQYFLEEQKRFSKEINPLEEFLDGKIGDEYDQEPGLFMPFNEFVQAYTQFLKGLGKHNVKFGPDHYRIVFENYGLSVTRKEQRMYLGQQKNCLWINGIGVRTVAADQIG